jgi:hypothetical protein
VGRWSRKSALVGQGAPACRPVLRLQLFAPAKRVAPIAEVSMSERAVIEEPHEQGSVGPRSNDGVTRRIRAPHSPHHGRLVVHEAYRKFGQAWYTRQRKYQPEERFHRSGRATPIRKVHARQTNVAGSATCPAK